jgi:Protein of unknown function (DUF1501)
MLHRRDAMIRLGSLDLGALTLPGLLRANTGPAARPTPKRRAKACIYIFLWGGPPQQDLWDMKPEAPQGIRSLFQPIKTCVPGIEICDQMPRLAQHTDKIAIVRSVTHNSNVHEASCYHMLTGRQNPTLISPRNQRRRTDFPMLGSVASYFTTSGGMPASVTIPRPIGHDGVTYAGTYAGFLGPRHDPLELKAAPNSNDQPAHAGAGPDLDSSRLIARHGLLNMLEMQERRLQDGRATEAFGAFQEQAFRMLSSPAAKRAFNMELEPPAIRDAYGRNEYGESFLLARRLVEAGVTLVSVIWMYFMPTGRIANVWDNHGGTGGLGSITGYAMLKEKYCIPPLDQAYAALLEDLSLRGLLDETLVVAVGEFGRTPKINATQGRDHWGMCQSALLAGGGVRGGQIYGATDKQAAYVKDNPVSPEDFLATIYAALGIAPQAEIHDRDGRPYRVVDGNPVESLFA